MDNLGCSPLLEVSGVKLFAVRCPLGLRDGMGWDDNGDESPAMLSTWHRHRWHDGCCRVG